ncbi:MULTISPECIES: TetR/AcrR family transcriptional regulator C-terminal domain-containing protein [unclassified Microcella]|uniref:TetR/AcrR family transcriptional regulator C-terminal domain-containing protein n=1 Tax=unclassified Microcella TaxID=2630066 RepID=UPI0006FA724F|nr:MULTISPECIES: TetR/AcrR family transcriptional regulator C-terminal domain-containing protein [unclassified Microcella]KQV24659.1 hypothetical protein ASC54_09060 [Yonghaparkia sp. Root332]KRF30949.1 hypothetical protein ASG83_08890 [Yonghaparkia sp. Soil809]
MDGTSRGRRGSTPGRERLDRSRVVGAAVALADRDGLDAVSMRRLADELGVVPMALYKHVADKRDLVAGMIDSVVAGYPRPASGEPWSSAVRTRVLGARAAHLAHPWLRPAIESATAPSPVVLAHMDALVGDLVSGGLSYDLAHHAMHALGHRIWGFSPEAFSTPAAPGEGADPVPDPERLAALARAFPHIAGVAAEQQRRHPAGCDEQFEFSFTLDLLLAAFARLHEAGWQSS